MLQTFRSKRSRGPTDARRRVADLLAEAEARREARERSDRKRLARARGAAAAERGRRLGKIGRDLDASWTRLEALVASSAYDAAVTLAVDLRDLARGGEEATFEAHFEAMRKRQSRRRGSYDRWKVTMRG